MKKLLRIIVAMIILIIVIAIFIAAALIFFINPNKIKPIIIQELARKTGYQIKVDGKLSWSFYPTLGIKAKRITITAPNETIPTADLRGVTFAADAKQLLHGYHHLQGDINITDVYVMKVHASNAHITVQSQDDNVVLQPINASLYSGKLQGNARVTHLRTMPHWNWDIEFNQIQMQPLLADLSSINSKMKIAGIGRLNVKGETAGKNQTDILRNLIGNGNVNVSNGMIIGLDLNYLVQTADDLINKRSISLPHNLTQTNFESLTATFNMDHGVIKSSDVLLDSTSFITKGRGQADLMNQTQDWQLQVVPVQEGQVKWMIPVLIDGSLSQPSVRLDMQLINAIITKEQIEKVKAKVQQSLKDLPAKANKFLEKLMSS